MLAPDGQGAYSSGMKNIPTPALVLGFAGLAPFLYGAALVVVPGYALPSIGPYAASPVGGRYLLATYGTIILCFMAGCLWGFAARHGRKPGWLELGATVTPPLILLALMGSDTRALCLVLTYLFALLLLIDSVFAKRTIVVWWWLSLRIPLTIIVSICLLIGAFL